MCHPNKSYSDLELYYMSFNTSCLSHSLIDPAAKLSDNGWVQMARLLSLCTFCSEFDRVQNLSSNWLWGIPDGCSLLRVSNSMLCSDLCQSWVTAWLQILPASAWLSKELSLSVLHKIFPSTSNQPRKRERPTILTPNNNGSHAIQGIIRYAGSIIRLQEHLFLLDIPNLQNFQSFPINCMVWPKSG